MLDLRNAAAVLARLDEYAASQHPPRGDEHLLHVSDIGGCNRETWARRHGQLADGFPPDTHRKFENGYDIEHDAIEALAGGVPVQTGLRIAMRVGLVGIEGRVVPEDYQPAPDEALGHPDGVSEDTVIEVKSTEFLIDRRTWERTVPDFTHVYYRSRHYLLQCSAYALALGKPNGLLVIQCRASGKIAAIPFGPHLLEAEVIERFVEAQATGTDAMPIPSLGDWTINNKQSWMCKYCRFDSCEFNRSKSIYRV